VTAFDFYFLAVLLAFTIGGFTSGFISKLFGLIGLIASIWAGMRLGSVFEPLFLGFFNNSMLRSLLASTFASLVVYAFFLVLGHVIAKAIKSSAIAPVDRMLGLFLGAAQAVVVIGIVVLVGQQFKVDQKDWWRNALFKQSGDQAAQLLDRVVDFKALSSRWLDAEMIKKMDAGRSEAEGLLGDMARPSIPNAE
jgi:uncharacterized membrane protein required for colicin V production